MSNNTFKTEIQEALGGINDEIKRIRLTDGSIAEGTVIKIGDDYIKIKRPRTIGGRSEWTIPLASILYFSDSDIYD